MFLRNKSPVLTCQPHVVGSTTFWLNSMIKSVQSLSAKTGMVYAADYSIWYQRMGHPGDDILQKLPDIVKGAPKLITIPMAKKPCEACAKGKMPSHSFPPSELCAMKPFQIIHSDINDMIKQSFNGYHYVLTILDDFTSHAWSFNLKKKSDTIIHAQQFIAYAKNQHNASIGTWRFDGRTEFINDAFKNMLRDNGILSETSVPYQHQQNSHAEPLNCMIMNKMQSMHFHACLTDTMWKFSWDHAIHVYNRTPIHRLKWQTSFEALRNEKPNVSHLRIFGCGAYVFLLEDIRANKLSPKSKTIVYLGQPAGYKGFCFYCITNGRIFIGATAVFDETYFPRCPDGKQQHFTKLGDELPTENRYPDDPIDQSDDNFGNQLPFSTENDNHPHHLLPSNLKFLMSLIETQNTLHTLRETHQYLRLNGMMRTLQGVVQDSKRYEVILTVSMAIECQSISNETTYAGELAVSQVASIHHLNSWLRIWSPDLVMHCLLCIRLLLMLMTTQGKTLWIPSAKHS